MSDTLPEREDEKTSDWHNFVPQDDYNVRLCAICGFGKNDHYRLYPQCVATVANWCDDCHGYTHMPWCPSCKEPDTRRSGEMGHRTNREQPASEHQPAARGGGDEWNVEGGSLVGRRRIRDSKNYWVADAASDELAEQIVKEHNEYITRSAPRSPLEKP